MTSAHSHDHDLRPWQHRHDWAADRSVSARRTHVVIAITLATMAAEIAAGWWWQSMALLADGWHMGTHAAAIGVAALAYALARRWAGDQRFSLGPWKIEVLGAYTSALLLGVVAIAIGIESGLRLFSPRAVDYEPSLWVAGVGLVVNLVCAWLLHAPGDGQSHHGHDHDAHSHDHDHDHAHPDHREHGGGDLNLKAAYLHVLADAATSVLAIGALLAGKFAGLTWLDPVMGLVGAALIAWWSRGLLAHTAKILLDREMDHPLAAQLRKRLEADGDARVADLHLWRVGDQSFAAHATLVADRPRDADAYRARMADLPELAHVSIEVNRCPQAGPT
ncbi:MAG: CDF family Co(II)/Ni(II) efflux transporter DmeF [Pseudomonadota bacterium]